MALRSKVNTVVKETTSLMAKLGLHNDGMLQSNFRNHGKAMGFENFSDYKSYAERIYSEAMNNPEAFTVINLPKSKTAVDFQSKMRGIYDAFGNPLAFFVPDTHISGYDDPEQELQEFINSTHHMA